ncbi:Xaa-Pro dipeptidase, partial [Klebsiella pneumoniae]
GIYFIESLLAPWREGPFSMHFIWQKIHAMKPFGRIRIEDNVVIHENSIENTTRDLKLA